MNLTIIENTNLETNAVDARALHAELGSKKDFSSWLKVKVLESEFFTEGVDYTLFTQLGENPIDEIGGRPRKDYLLSIDCAKMVAMMEKTERGNEVRLYFLEV